MPVKDRMPELEKSLDGGNKEGQNGSGSGAQCLDKIFKQVETVSGLINNVEANTRRCEEILLGKTKEAPKEQQSQLLSTFKESEMISLKISKLLKQMKNEVKGGGDRGAEGRMKYVQYTSLLERFKGTLEAHQQCVQRHGDVRRELLEKSAKIVRKGRLVDPSEIEELVERNQTQLFTQDYLSEEMEARRQLVDVESRHKELLAIESHLIEIRDLFVQMAVLIEQQQESVNRVEHHALTAAEYVDQTVDDLQVAETSQKKSRKVCIYVWIGVAVFLALLILIILVK